MTTCSTVYMLQVWQMLDNSQMLCVCVFMCRFYGEQPVMAFPPLKSSYIIHNLTHCFSSFT